MAFHSRDGFCFERKPDGSVEITKHLYGRISVGGLTANDGYADVVAYRVTLPANEWASVVATVSQHGEDFASWRTALDFHGDTSQAGQERQSAAGAKEA